MSKQKTTLADLVNPEVLAPPDNAASSVISVPFAAFLIVTDLVVVPILSNEISPPSATSAASPI